MCFWFFKKKKKAAPVQEEVKSAAPVEEKKEEAPVPKEEEHNEVKEAVKEPEPVKEAVKEEPVPQKETATLEKPKAKSAPAKKPAKKDDSRYSGKYEIYPEAGMFKFRLKASNGEILLVSTGYKTREGAESGIKTIKKNIPLGNALTVTDKNGFSQFRISTSNNARLIIAGEYYNTMASCESALKSTEKFSQTDKIVQLDSIPASEVREEIVKLTNTDKATTGKIEIFIDSDKKYRGRLIASNGEVLFVTNDYVNKPGVLVGLKPIKDQVAANAFHICRDKQNRYQFRLYSSNGTIILTGETYPSKDSAISAADSVRKFISDAPIVDSTKKPVKEEKK